MSDNRMKMHPCPFPSCGKGEMRIGIGVDALNGVVYYAQCVECAATGPRRPTAVEAVEAWNGPIRESEVKNLQACPFCKSRNLTWATDMATGGNAVECHSCGSRGGLAIDQETAAEKWNRRAR